MDSDEVRRQGFDAGALDGLMPSIRAALARHPTGVVVGVTAAALWGAVAAAERGRPELAGDHPVELVVEGSSPRPSPGLHVRRDRLATDEVIELQRIPATTPTRTAYDIARRLPTVDAVMILERFGRVHGVALDDVRRMAAEHPHARGLTNLRAALRLVEPGARAGVESRVRIALQVAGIRAPVVGHVVVDGWAIQQVDRQRFEAQPDLVIEDVERMLRRNRQRLGLDRSADLRWSRPRRRHDTVRVYP